MYIGVWLWEGTTRCSSELKGKGHKIDKCGV